MLGRFAQADSLVPRAANPLAWDRYAYVNNSPVNFSDPSGHMYERGGYDLEPGGEYADYVYNVVYDNNTRQVNQAKVETTVAVVEVVASVVFEPLDWYYTGMDIADGNFSPLMLLGLLPFVPHSAASKLEDGIDLLKQTKTTQEITQDLQELAKLARKNVDELGMEAYTKAQLSAGSKYPHLMDAYYGTAIDKEFKKLAQEAYPDFKYTRQGKYGPDVVDSSGNRWWDITTIGDWSKHQNRYEKTYGKNSNFIGY